MKIVKVVGGLGSQMFAYALYLSLKEKYDKNEKIYLDTSSFDEFQQHNGYELENIFNFKTESSDFVKNLITKKTLLHKFIYRHFFKKIDASKKNYNFDKSVFTNSSAIYYQCWTSWKYFESCEKTIKNSFKFPKIDELENIEIANIINSTNSVSIHVRRGDYLNSPALKGLAPEWYYNDAISHINQNVENPNYFVFSDDISWCKENLQLENAKYIDWNKNHKSYRDIQLMSMCKHNIIPNSSFSWWGAYLNNNNSKIVITPERWGNIDAGAEIKDMNHPQWVVLKNYID
ncbi:alpha-1,2-fucosyltransferase [Vibrio navarrensis]|uniref:alpha-1,2-fucosyltransferase n=1 Tax=Vibrio navarrensis TaxID=29495 RepID=UPI001869762D|nr:alpha-1,2-fucosyltransferase [Vibrio navarrensis]MBE4618683.1 alpha-1,2-fucosyltransferase [Vibrio navarrensis]